MFVKLTELIRREHLDFVVDVEIAESILEPAELPRRIFKDRMNPLESMRPLEFRITFGMSKGGRYLYNVCKKFWSPSPQWSYIKDI